MQEPLARNVVLAVQANNLDMRDAILVRHNDADGEGALHVGVGVVVGDEFECSRGSHLENRGVVIVGLDIGKS